MSSWKNQVLYAGLLIWLGVANLTQADEPAAYPRWSWERVPIYLHFGSRSQLTDEQVRKATSISSFVCLEKAHGRLNDPDRPERVMSLDAKRLKQANPDVRVLMYWNTLIAWPFTSYNRRFADSHPSDWTLRNRKTGEPLLKTTLGRTPVYQYNLLNAETRAWWARTAGEAVKDLGFDGLFMDAISQARRPTLLNNGWGRDKGEELDLAVIDMMKQVRSVMGRDRLLIYNGLRTQNGVVNKETQGDAKFLPYADGAMIEHFDQFASASKEDIVLYWKMAKQAADHGKIVLYRAWPDHDANFTNEKFMKQSQTELEAFARAKITFPLACYLIGVQRHAYFSYDWGYDAADGQLVEYPEYMRRLGAPKGDATRLDQSWVFTRDFEHVSVRVDLEKREASIKWNAADVPVAAPSRATPSKQQDWAALRDQVIALGKLADAPTMHEAEGFKAEGNIKPIYFDGLPWKDQPTRVFAWLGLPQPDGKTTDTQVPGVVLVHGGGGTAFKEWVKKWNDQGFAAISIAVEGQTDRRESKGSQWQRHEWAGPARNGIYGDSGERLADQWMYHAVADTILANSLLRQLPQVDADKVGIMGISWGGVITSTAMGIDRRFAFAVPTYGCGSLADADNQYGRALGHNVIYRQVWDPLLRMKDVKMPVLWLSWTGDQHFPLDAQRRCYAAAPGPHLVALLPNMKHGHAPGWNPPDSYAFARSVVQTGSPWCQQRGLILKANSAQVTFTSTQLIDRAILVSTADAGFTGLRKWTEATAKVNQDLARVTVEATIPSGTTTWFLRLHSGDLVACSDLQETRQE